MSDLDLPTLSLSELLVRRKYQNVNNLLTSRNTYYNHKNGTFDFQRDILDNSTATMAFRLIHFHVNWSFIEELCGSYVLGLGQTEWVKKETEVRKQILVAEEAILAKHHLIGSFIGMPVEKTAERYISAWKIGTVIKQLEMTNIYYLCICPLSVPINSLLIAWISLKKS